MVLNPVSEGGQAVWGQQRHEELLTKTEGILWVTQHKDLEGGEIFETTFYLLSFGRGSNFTPYPCQYISQKRLVLPTEPCQGIGESQGCTSSVWHRCSQVYWLDDLDYWLAAVWVTVDSTRFCFITETFSTRFPPKHLWDAQLSSMDQKPSVFSKYCRNQSKKVQID